MGFRVSLLNSLFMDMELKQNTSYCPWCHLSPKKETFFFFLNGVFSPGLVLIKCFVCMISLTLTLLLPDELRFSSPILQIRKLRSREVKSRA